MNLIKDRHSCDWAILNSSISNPTEDDLKEGMDYFFRYSDAEHPDAWLHCGTDDGPLFELAVYKARRTWFGRQICDIAYKKFDDQDMNIVLETKEPGTFSKGAALDLWKKFITELLRAPRA